MVEAHRESDGRKSGLEKPSTQHEEVVKPSQFTVFQLKDCIWIYKTPTKVKKISTNGLK